MSATLSIAAILTLKDQLSAPLRVAQSGVAALAAQIKETNGVAQKMSIALGGVADAARRVATLSAQAAAAGQLATGFGLETYARNAMDVEHRLAALGNTANMSNGELDEMYDRIKQAARATNQFTSDLLTANEQLIAAGLEWRKALDITPVLGKVATATQATMGDLAQTAYALSSNLRVPVEQMQAAFERLTVAGQSGQFELKDMAREFAKLGASMGSLRLTGLENVSRLGAALQIARRGAGDAAEAANNLQNFLVKLAAPEVQKNFAKFGIDLPRLLKRARDEGLDPFLVTLKAIQKATGGDEFKLGELFGDMQVQNFIKPMLLYTEDYKKLVAEIDSANGVIEGNFTRMMGTTAERWKQFRIQLETTPMPWLDALIDKLSAVVQWMNQNEELAGRLATGLVALGAAAATAPLEDFNLRRQMIPTVLLQAEANPYDLRNLNQCTTIGAEVARLDEELGPDTGEPPRQDGSYLSERAADAAAKAALNAIRKIRLKAKEQYQEETAVLEVYMQSLGMI
mgnify:CR=1 FL=1